MNSYIKSAFVLCLLVLSSSVAVSEVPLTTNSIINWWEKSRSNNIKGLTELKSSENRELAAAAESILKRIPEIDRLLLINKGEITNPSQVVAGVRIFCLSAQELKSAVGPFLSIKTENVSDFLFLPAYIYKNFSTEKIEHIEECNI